MSDIEPTDDAEPTAEAVAAMAEELTYTPDNFVELTGGNADTYRSKADPTRPTILAVKPDTAFSVFYNGGPARCTEGWACFEELGNYTFPVHAVDFDDLWEVVNAQ